MSGRTYTARAIVAGKTRLGESDAIMRMVDEQGRLMEAIAKGVRKPQSSLSGRLELFNTVEVHCAEGRSLDVVRDARLVESHPVLHTDPAYSAAAACVAELACKTAQPELEVPRMFDLTRAAFLALSDATMPQLPYVTSAYVFKASAFLGMRPSFTKCVSCGEDVIANGVSCATSETPVAERQQSAQARFSYIDGGVFCESCAAGAETLPAPLALMGWAEALLHMPFSEILAEEGDEMAGTDLLHLAEQWSLVQLGVRLRSLPHLIAYLHS